MRRDPPEIYGWRVFALACAFSEECSLAGIVSTLQAGCFIASLVACPFADKYGRRWPLIFSALVACVGVGLQAAQTGSLPMMYFGRLVAGFGVGAASMLTPLSNSMNEGLRLSFTRVNFGSTRHAKHLARNPYTIPLALQALPAIFMIAGMLFCPESPRYTAKNGDWAKTAAILSQLTRLPADHPYLQKELQQMADQLEVERRLVGGATAWTLLREMWTIRPNRERALTSIALMVCQQLTGVNAINYYAPQIFHAMGVYGVENSLLATGVYGIVKVVACAAFLIFAADSLGRRLSLLWTSVAQAACMFVVGAYVYSSEPGERLPIPPFGYMAIISVYLFAALTDNPSEIPSTRLRAMNVAQAAATQWLFNFIVARTVPTMMTRMGKDGYGTFFLFGAFSLAMAPFTYRLIPETKGRRLEEMDKLFGITEVLEAMERLHHDNNNVTTTTTMATPTTETTMNLPRMTNVTVDTTMATETTQRGMRPYSNDTAATATSFLLPASPLSSSSTARPGNQEEEHDGGKDRFAETSC
ncbi:hypothetical protein DL769_002772 [Monosporascus sp. CRB-8-3]|nr:hypothetical protein DL769_002772 [Monosporascus sp. CRB-8-3]